jgi:hypothetical protein
MTHEAFLADAITRPPFGPIDGDDLEVRDDATGARGASASDHLAGCAACRATLTAVRADAAAISSFAAGDPSAWVRSRVLRAASGQRSAWRGASRLLVVGLLGVAALAGGVAGGGALLGLRTVAEAPIQPPSFADAVAAKPIIWKTNAVILAADAIELTANGTVLHPGASPVKVGGDPGDLKSATLEVGWAEGGVEQRIYLYLAADATSWWMSEVRAYDNVAPKPEWATLGGLVGRRPLGTAYVGDLDLEGPSEMHPTRARLRVTGAVLQFAPQPNFIAPPGGGVPLEADPFSLGGPLQCSGILQMRPVDAERELLSRGFRISWRFETKTGPNMGFADLRLQAPATGWISDTEIGSNGELIIFVQDPVRPAGDPIAIPDACEPAPSP